MKICRFINENRELYGALHNGRVFPFPDTKEFGDVTETLKLMESFDLSEIKLLPPATPSKIVCVGRNYAEHAAELGNEVPKEPLLFLKAPSALITEGEAIIIPEQSNQVEHEGELAVVIGRECRKLSEPDNPFDYVFGYTCLNDVTARDLQRKDVQFTRAKSFDTFCPIGAFIETELKVSDLRVVTKVNGSIKQDGRTAQMVFPVDFLIRYISNMMTLNAGDIIATGTPSGVSKLNKGDVCEVEIEGVGSLRNPVQ
ncbi:MAG TPA: fumarylacetoacetate hydrolase family protein [Pyrinomonadaceae bacterium]|jgi:2-keto-4-pentenoate hydratase/2-oxohepta-3-ene-1,7-dioic acid hydratase in catechol pathway